MRVNRRDFIEKTGLGLATVATLGASVRAQAQRQVKIGICDWNLGKPCQPADIPKAKEAGLQGIQVSIALDAEKVPLRDPEYRETYLTLGQKNGIAFNSVAAGVLNQIPLKSEPQAAVLVVEAIEAAAALGAKNILLAFFGAGDLRLSIGKDQYQNVSKNQFKSYELDEPGVRRVVEVLRQLVPRAERLGVVLGIEDTLTAAQNLEMIEKVGSEVVQVYYDVGNSTEYGYDVPGEIRMLGKDRICEIHLKDWHTPLLGSAEGAVDFPAAANACRDIGFDKWYVLETSGREGRFLEDTRANIEFVRKMFL